MHNICKHFRSFQVKRAVITASGRLSSHMVNPQDIRLILSRLTPQSIIRRATERYVRLANSTSANLDSIGNVIFSSQSMSWYCPPLRNGLSEPVHINECGWNLHAHVRDLRCMLSLSQYYYYFSLWPEASTYGMRVDEPGNNKFSILEINDLSF
jgi:hypothetical protein